MLCVSNETTSIVGKFNGVTIMSHELAHMVCAVVVVEILQAESIGVQVAEWLAFLHAVVIATVVMCCVRNPVCTARGRYINGRSIKKCLHIPFGYKRHSKYRLNTKYKNSDFHLLTRCSGMATWSRVSGGMIFGFRKDLLPTTTTTLPRSLDGNGLVTNFQLYFFFLIPNQMFRCWWRWCWNNEINFVWNKTFAGIFLFYYKL